MIVRVFAAGATGAGLVGGVGLVVAVASSAPWRYVSESGVAGAPHPALYRGSMLVLAAALGLLAGPAWRTSRPAGLVAVALALAAPLAGLSGVVTCSPGCPLPPYETPAARDLVHAAGAIGALLLCALAMLLYAAQPDDTALRRAGRFGVVLAFPPLALSAVGLAFVGRGLFTGVAERAALVAVCTWLVLTAALHRRAKP